MSNPFQSPASSFPDHQRPTRARFIVLAFLCSLSFVLYIDRVCIGKAATAIQNDLDISNTQMGWVHGVFIIAYGLFEVPTGRLGDRYGSRGVLTRIVIWWSAFTALTGAALNLPMLLVTRFLFGAGEAGGYPNAARVTAQWFSPRARGAAQGVVLTSAQVGGAIAPAMAAYLIAAVGWRMSFVLFGSLGLVWAAAFCWWFRDDPQTHPAVNDTERALIADGRAPHASGESHPPIPWRAVFSNYNVWLLGFIQSCGAFAHYMYLSWFPAYLEKAWGVDSIRVGWLSTMVLSGAVVGCLAGGFITDALVRFTGSRRRTYSGYGFATLALAGVAVLASIYCSTPMTASLCAAVACMMTLSSQAAWWGATTEISGRHVGALFGLMNSMGVPGGFASNVFLGMFADWRMAQGFTGRAQWDPALYVYALVLAIGAVSWLAVNVSKRVEES